MMKSAFNVKELIREIGIGRTTLYKEMADGKIKAKSIRSRPFFTRDEVVRYLDSLPDRH